MNRKLQLSLISLFVLLLPNYSVAEVNLTKLVKQVQPTVVTVIAYDKDKKVLRQGTGFFVDTKGHIITNYHVLIGAVEAEVKAHDGKRYPIKFVMEENESIDLVKVLVDVPEKVVQFINVTKEIPDIAEQILVVGSPMGLEQTVSEGIISAIRELPGLGKIFQISASISPGSSGSPVVNRRGEVIGVATFYLLEGQNLNFAVPGEYILNRLCPPLEYLDESAKGPMSIFQWTALQSLILGSDASSLYDNGEYKKAIEVNKKLIRFYQDGFAYFELGKCYAELGQHRDAIEAFKEGIRIRPDYYDAWAYYVLGVSHVHFDEYRDAIEAFKQAIRLFPDFADFHSELGLCYDALDQPRDAIGAFKQAIQIEPDHARAHLALGMTYLVVGNRGAALQEYKILKGLDRDKADELFNLIYK